MNRKAFIKSCRRNGYKYIEIAKILGLSRQRIEQILRPEKHRARVLVKKIKLKSLSCQYPDCNNSKTEAHHWDYSKPLDIVWLCVKHHKEYHKKIEIKKKKIKLCNCGKEAIKGSIFRHCKECSHKRKLKMARLNWKNNPEKRRKQKILVLQWKRNNPEKWKAINRKAKKKYLLTHPQRYKGYNKEYYEKNREKMLLNWRNYYKRNKERIDKKKKEYYIRKKANRLIHLTTFN